jgi:hypothetical protein
MLPNTRYVQKLSGLVFSETKGHPGILLFSERVLTCLDLITVGTLAATVLSLVGSQIKNGSVCLVVAFRMTEKTEGVCIKFC